MRTRTCVAVALTLLGSACGKKEEAAPAPTKTTADKPAKSAEPAPAKPAEPAVAPAKDAPPPAGAPDALIDYDLSSQGAAWTGWTVKSPPDGKLEANEGTFKGGIALRWGNGAGAMGFKQGKVDWKSIKHDLSVTGDKVAKETADELDTTMTMAGTTLQCFYQKRKVADVDVACWTVSCVMDDAELARAHAICDSLAKK
jgi:hypothetical protein